jgi:hypothetical protein
MPRTGDMSRMPESDISSVNGKGMPKSAGVLLAVAGTERDWLSLRSTAKSTPRGGQMISPSGTAEKSNEAAERSGQLATRGSESQSGDADKQVSAEGDVVEVEVVEVEAEVEAEAELIVEKATAAAGAGAQVEVEVIKSKGSETEKSKLTKASKPEAGARGSLQLEDTGNEL